MLNDLLVLNVDWSEQRCRDDTEYFARLAGQQTPEFFWIGCSDSRVPANVLAGLDTCEVFVQRNIVNVIHSTGMSMLSKLEFVVNALRIREVIVCGHYGCGGVKAATEDFSHGFVDHWLEAIRRLARAYAVDLAQEDGAEARRDRLAELNVIESVRRVAETPIMQRAWGNAMNIRIHGLIYGLKDDRMRDLDCTVGPSLFEQGTAQ